MSLLSSPLLLSLSLSLHSRRHRRVVIVSFVVFNIVVVFLVVVVVFLVIDVVFLVIVVYVVVIFIVFFIVVVVALVVSLLSSLSFLIVAYFTSTAVLLQSQSPMIIWSIQVDDNKAIHILQLSIGCCFVLIDGFGIGEVTFCYQRSLF
jgi:hypothetical protein